MKNNVLLALAAALTSWFGGLIVGVVLVLPGTQITAAHGVWSPCGFYNIITTHADGTQREYAEAPPSPEVMAQINELPADKRSVTTVPCPTMQVPQREAKSQEIPEARIARYEAPRDGAHRSGRSG